MKQHFFDPQIESQRHDLNQKLRYLRTLPWGLASQPHNTAEITRLEHDLRKINLRRTQGTQRHV